MAELLFSELRTLISEVATSEAKVKELSDCYDKEKEFVLDLDLKNEEISIEKENLTQQVNGIVKEKTEKEESLNEMKKEKIAIDHKVKNFDSMLAELMIRSKELLEASAISKEIQDALTALDRRQLSEISKLGSPPIIVKKALEILMIFIEIFGSLSHQSSSSSSSSSASSASSEPLNSGNKFKKEKEWNEIRKFMAIDIRPQIINITPILISNYENSVLKLKEMMNSIESNKISKASQPTGILYDWCKAILECAYSIIEKNKIDIEIENMKNEFPNLEKKLFFINESIDKNENDLKIIINNENNILIKINENIIKNDKNVQIKNDKIIIIKKLENDKIENEIFFKNVKNELEKCSEKVKDEIEEIKKQISITNNNIKKLIEELEPIETEYNELKISLYSLKNKEIELFESSKLPTKVVEKLQTLDRRALSEITRLSSPPKIIQSSLEVVYVFLEVFLTEENAPSVLAASAAAASDSSKSPNKSTKSPNKKKTDGLPHADWPAIRKLLAVDLRPKLLAITPEVVSQEKNEEIVMKLKVKMSSLESKSIEKASKPCGLLWLWCSALVVCDDSIKFLREISAQIKQQEVQEKPLLNKINKIKVEISKEQTKLDLYNELTSKL